jgi:hypothetical protein
METCKLTKRNVAQCEAAIEEIRRQRPTGDLWERRWASLLALLRTSCDVLEKEAPCYWQKHMKEPNAHIKGRDAEKNWKPDIYGKFIQTDANLFLHEGELREAQSIMPRPLNMQARVQGINSPDQALPPFLPTYHMNIEPYKGRDALIVAGDAVEWLRSQISIAEAP